MVSEYLSAQTPIWCNDEYRDTNYPSNTYYTGYATYIKQRHETKESATTKAQELAYKELAQQITVNISSSSQNIISANSINGNYDEQEIFQQVSSIATNANVTNTKTNDYFDPNTSIAYAFVYVEKDDLINSYTKSLDMLVIQMRNHLETANTLITQNEKSVAQKECESVFRLIPQAANHMEMLAIINPDFDHTGYSTELSLLRNNATKLKSSLSQSILVYLEVNGEMQPGLKDMLFDEVMNSLTEKASCSSVSDKSNADYKIIASPSLRYSSYDGGIYYIYADIELQLFNCFNKRVTYTNSYSAKGAASAESKASRKALQKAAKQIADDLILKIK